MPDAGTPNSCACPATPAVHPSCAPRGSRRSDRANAFPAPTRDVKPLGTRQNRTAGGETAARRQNARSNPAGHQKSFRSRPADDPRRPHTSGWRERFSAVAPCPVAALASGGSAPAGALVPFRWNGTAAAPSTPTTAAIHLFHSTSASLQRHPPLSRTPTQFCGHRSTAT